MNKLVKGAVATAVGAALLMGGAGTFAYWNDSVGITGGTIVAGNLSVVDATPSDGVWTVQKDGTGTATTVPAIASFVASPGDRFTYTKTVKINATGNNLVATLALTPGSIAAVTPATAANTALASYLTSTASISATGTGISAGSVAGTYNVTAGAAGVTSRDVTLTVVINFPKSTTAGFENNTKLGSVNLSGLAVTLNQQ
ncbi:alternate signal-mediated exported protein [Conyzicola lurida]|uniref:Alternate signal-mediated exported protein n=1 Tax=Conyzicola lurida TaxID=1172621 RepID=A0A841APD9_9MICO|nr:alternate-type signal peptide domain-containing protein [Conyzicola lurida]MBB5843822.1 alternate signal-mediated exported protein [Conyzicola lurida]